MNTGIAQSVIPGMVSEYECRSSCLSNNYNWSRWLELEDWERAYCVAYTRVSHAIEANISDVYSKYQERLARRGRGRR